MGNCYSAESNSHIETSLQNTTVARRQKADFSSADHDGSADTIDIEGQETLIIADAVAKMSNFVTGLASSEYYNQTVADILGAGLGGPFDIATLPREVSVISLVYRESQQLEDGSLYSGLWNETSNAPEGLGALVAVGGASLYEGWFKEGKANGKGRKVVAEEREVYFGDFVNGLRHGDGVAHA